MEQAQDLVFRGDVTGARRLAERAKSFPVEWKANELSPEKFLAQLDARGARAEAPSTTIAKRPDAKPARSGAQTADYQVPGAKKQVRAPIAQASNEEPSDEPLSKSAVPAANRPANQSPTEKLALAKGLMQQARREMANGDYDAARAKAQQAEQLEVAYSLFDETPEQLLTEIDRLDSNAGESTPRSRNIAQSRTPARAVKSLEDEEPFDPATPQTETAKNGDVPFDPEPSDMADQADSGELPAVENDQQLSQQLLSQAQAAIAKGDLEQARTLALQAQELDVTYGLFDLQPHHVLAEIDRAANHVTITKNGLKGKLAAKTLPKVNTVAKELPTDSAESASMIGDGPKANSFAKELPTDFAESDSMTADRPKVKTSAKELLSDSTESDSMIASQPKVMDSAKELPTNKPFAASAGKLPPSQNDQQRARQLLSQAQAAIAKGNLEQARSLA
ncbi:MAG TPA: hypothetical protein VK137_01155, partial [Planctomycetaceae bacterium]|nr:hypothetical protein [Planctomycetaceae bacterium]